MVFNLKNQRGNLYLLFSIWILFYSTYFSAQNTQKSVFNPLADKNKSVLFYSVSSQIPEIDTSVIRVEFNNSFFIKDQEQLLYDYCKSYQKCNKDYEKQEGEKMISRHDEITGFARKSHFIWLHPPRSDDFKILELNAFPYYSKFQNTWENTITFGQDWGNKKWAEWEGTKTAVSHYHKAENSIFLFKDEKLDCIKIDAETDIEGIGKTTSVFYYNDRYGFVKMIFTTINKKKIELNLINVL
ncbi:hypothetical protein EGI16_12520 [Chryseobacterium sp. G0240]|nr:hypothetical protein EGI16_12520 [Chryseobacterium sp. G0240]